MEALFEPLDTAVDLAASEGASASEAFLESELGLTVKVFGEKVEKFSYSETRGLGLRVWSGERLGRAYTSDLSTAAIGDAVKKALASAGVSPEEPHRRLPDEGLFPGGSTEGRLLGEGLDIWYEDLETTPTEEKIDLALGLEKMATQRDPRITGVETSTYEESSGMVLLANSEGFRSGYRSSICIGYLITIAEDKGDTQTGFGFTAGRSFGSLDCEAAAAEATAMAVDLLGARPVPTARVPVLLNDLSAAELLGALSFAVSGEAVSKGRSFLVDRLGENIASESFNVVDDGRLPGGFGTAPFDAEGVAMTGKVPVSKGTLTGFLHNCYTASRMGVATTGNAGRASFRSQVGVRPSNLALEPGESSPQELRSGMERGLEVLELQGVHVGLNPVTGEVSVGARGRWVERGRPSHAVREVTIAGKMEEVLKGVMAVGSDLRYMPLLGGIGAPSVLVEGLTVSGK